MCRARDSDLDTLAGLTQRCLGDGWTRSALKLGRESRSARVRIAEDEAGVPIGFAVARRAADLLELDLVGVVPERRRRGVAVDPSRRVDRKRACGGRFGGPTGTSGLECRGGGTLYAELGFVVVDRRTRYYPDGEDALLLTSADEC